MHTNEPRELQGVELGYDPRDIDARGIYRVVVYFFLFTLFFFGGGAIIFVRMGLGAHTELDARKPAFAGPKLQGNMDAKIDIMTMRQQERHLMTTYETLPGGAQRIPVDRAMELVAAQGLPEVKDDRKAVSPGNTIPQNATGPAASSTTTSPSESAPGDDALHGVAPASNAGAGEPARGNPTPNAITPPTPDAGVGATGTTAGMGGSGTP